MIKKAKKSVAIGLSVALAVTSVNIPVDSASAAAKKAKLSATKKTLTAGKSTTLTLKTNKKKAKTIKTIKAKYVKVSTSKKSVATVKKVSKKSKVTGIKVTAKKAGKATITVKVTKGTYKGTYKCTVTVKKKASATKKPTQKPTEVPTATPEVTVEPTVEPTTTPTITAEPATTPAITAEPATTPAITATPEVKSVVTKADDVLKDGKTFKVSLSLETALKADDLKDTTIKLTKGSTVVTGKFANLDASGKAVYEIADDADVKALTPGDTTANGTYKVTSDAKVLVLENITTVYEEALAGNAIEGFVTTYDATVSKYVPVKNAVVSVDGGQSKTTDANGYYKLPSVNGQKKVSVKAAGYLDNNNKGARVYVNRNHVTSQNFVMEAYDVNKVFTNITVQDETKQKTPVKDATITIADSANKDVIKAVTDANGKVSFGNKSVTDDKLTATAADNKKKAADWEQYFVNGQTYTIYAEKKLSIANLDDVFVKQKIGTFTVGNTYDYSDTFTATRVKKTPSLTLTQKLADTDVTTEVSKTVAGSEGKMDVQYTVYTTVNGGAPEKILDETTAVETDKIANNSVATDLISKVAALNNATLPTGNYYVVVNPTDVNDANSVRVAKAAVKVAVTEGTAAASSVTITRGYLRELETNVSLTTEEEKAQGTIAEGNALKTVTKSATGYVTATPGVEVKLNYAVYQMVDGVAIPMETTHDNAVTATAKKTFVASGSEYNRLLGTGTYQITVEGDYIVNSTKTESINNKVNEKLTYNVDAAWNLIKANIKATDKSVIDQNIKVDDAKLMKVVAKNVSTGELTTIFDALGVTANGIAPTTSSVDPVAVGTTLDYDLTSKVLSATNLKAGNYILTYSINGYKDVTTTAEVSTIGLLEADNTFDAALVKATSDKTTIAGKITTKDARGTTAPLDGTAEGTNTKTKAFVMLLDSTGKIAAVSTVTKDGEYSLIDGEHTGADKIVGGAYTLIVRSEGYETKAVTVTVDANKQITENVELEAGACGEIKAVVTDTNVNAITDTSARPMAYDKLYVVPSEWNNTVSGKSYGDLLVDEKNDGVNEYNVGAYVGTVNGKIYTFANLPAGTYTVRAGEGNWASIKAYDFQSSTAYKYEDKTVVIKGNGDKVYPEWEFAKNDAAGSSLVNLDVKFDSTAQTAVGTGVYVVVVTDADGNIETKAIVKSNNDTKTQVQVTSGKSYTVTLYTETGYQVTSNTVNVQKVDTSVSLTANLAAED